MWFWGGNGCQFSRTLLRVSHGAPAVSASVWSQPSAHPGGPVRGHRSWETVSCPVLGSQHGLRPGGRAAGRAETPQRMLRSGATEGSFPLDCLLTRWQIYFSLHRLAHLPLGLLSVLLVWSTFGLLCNLQLGHKWSGELFPEGSFSLFSLSRHLFL